VIIFDSWALLAFFQAEPEAIKVKSIIEEAWETDQKMKISAINLGEICYNIARRHGKAKATETCEHIKTIGIDVEEATLPRVFNAAAFKSRGGISYADAFAAALAVEFGGTLITGDREFEKFASAFQIKWLT
jgi:predicted nucleic acid-binding protein